MKEKRYLLSWKLAGGKMGIDPCKLTQLRTSGQCHHTTSSASFRPLGQGDQTSQGELPYMGFLTTRAVSQMVSDGCKVTLALL